MEVQEIKTVHVVYVCGNTSKKNAILECGKESKLKPNDAVKCTDCGYRILYKKRSIDPKEPVQYEAI
jgi:DNA-directed RNA polymerase I, II, and III subunit RPABC4